MDVSLVGPRGGGRVWVIWVIGGWNMSAVVVEKSTRDPCVDAGRRDECRGGWVTRDGTGDVDARVASRGSFGRERGGRASVVCVCVCVCVCVGFVRASREWTSRSRARRGFGFGFEQRIRVVSIDRGRAAGAIARAGSMASRAHHRCATGAQASVSRGRKMMRRSRAMGATRARARAVAGAVRAAGGADGARRGGGGAWGGESRGFVRRERAEREEWTRVDGEKCGERGREGVDVQGDGGGRIGTRRGGRRRGERARVAEKTSGSAARHLGVEGDEHGWRR